MTEKRFEMVITGADGSFHYLDKNTGEKITSTLELENKLNELHEENEYLCEKIKENEWHWNTIDEDKDVWMYKCKKLEEENEQLKQRNNRQAKQLDNLYHLIEKQDWKTLNGLIQEFQECEEQLQREWRTYE